MARAVEAMSGEAPALGAKYRVGAPIGEGGMGVVYAGVHADLGTRVAIKVLQAALSANEQARARFLREARLAASIESDHSTRIHDVGTDEEGRPYMVMEHLVGEGTNVRLARERRMPLADAATIVLQLLDALAEAHAKGLVHRDLKPANLFLVERPGEAIWVKVLDFGISKRADEDVPSGSALTEPRTILGSPHYMSPEQLKGAARIDARSDIWACGVLLHELLTGELPFQASSLPELYAKIMSEPPRPLAAAVPEALPAAVVRVVARCLRKDPAARPRSAYELGAALAPFASASARAALPRLRAWSQDEPDAPVPARHHRSIVGLGIVGAAGVLAFAAATFRAPTNPGGRTVATGTLEPVPSTSPVAPAPEVALVPSSALPPPSASAAPPSPRPPAARARTPRPDALDKMDLLP